MQNIVLFCIYLYLFCGCIIATFITKTWLSTPMWDKDSVVCCWHWRHVFLFRNIYTCQYWPRPHGSSLDLDLWVLALFNMTGACNWQHNFQTERSKVKVMGQAGILNGLVRAGWATVHTMLVVSTV